MFSAARILAIRKSKGFSQELLAEQSGVSLRTIQRVEQGETVPRGHTMQALATALEVPLEALLVAPTATLPLPTPSPLPTPPGAPGPLRADPQFLQMLNLSALCFLVFPFLNLLVPFLLWRKHRYDTEHVAEVGRRILGFQMLWQVGCFFSYLMVLLLQVAALHYFGVVLKGVFIAVFVLTYLTNVVAVGHNQLLLRRGRLDVYRIRL
ncbi:MAG: helix-turn-helix transcriptional regulator [Hymenobacter sp.]|nr:helix-turn-helix transcriptional regulator [Hymenobacter sp.]